MLANLDKLICQTEEKWLMALYNQCKMQFELVHLPSHDEIHHLRVWNNAKILLHHTVRQGTPVSETDIERLIIAVFFHDQGMSESLSKEHGQISRHICKTFFPSSGMKPPAGFDNVLQAIENHDQKDYKGGIQAESKFDVQQLLNIADDLDALGIIGAYRYIEIYLLRHIKTELLSEAVLANLGGRFQHFSDVFADDPSLIKAQSHRYISAKNYYKDLNMQLKLVEYNPDSYLGPAGVINYIKNEVIGNKRKLKEVSEMAISANKDFYVTHFFERLEKELAVK